MAETQTDTDVVAAPPPPSFDDMLKPPLDLQVGLTSLKADKARETERITTKIDQDLDRGSTIASSQLHAMGVGPEQLKPWNADEQYKKYHHDPVEAFGSIGSVFGIVASLFTHQPMTNALNASAAAMNAIREGDEKGYARAYKAWQDNTDLAIKRFNIQNSLYRDALDLMSTNAAAGKTKLLNSAARFGDKQALLMLESGMDKELFDTMSARAHMATELTKARDGMTDYAIRERVRQQLEEQNNPDKDPYKSLENFKYSQGVSKGWQADLVQKYVVTPDPDTGKMHTPEEVADFSAKITGRLDRLSPDQQWIMRRKEEFPEESLDEFTKAFTEYKQGEKAASPDQQWITRRHQEHPDESLDDFSKAYTQYKRDQKAPGAGNATFLTPNRINAAEIDRRMKQYIGEGADPTAAFNRASNEVKEATSLKNFTASQTKLLSVAPTLMTHLRTLDYLADPATGPIRGVPQKIAAEYFGVNDPAAVWQAAKKGADAALTELASGGRVSVMGLRQQLHALPETMYASEYNKKLAQQALRDLSDKARSEISLMETEGKKVPPLVMDRFIEQGIYPESMRKQDPLLAIRESPATVPDDTLQQLRRASPAYTLEDQKLIAKEVQRRMLEWEKQHGGK